MNFNTPDGWINQYNERFLYIHIPRTGGQSIKRSLNIFGKPHKTISELVREQGVKAIAKKHVITFVRNPLTRFASIYDYMVDKTILPKCGVGEFVRLVEKTDFEPFGEWSKDLMVIPQVRFLELNGFLRFDFLGRFETLREDFWRLIGFLKHDSWRHTDLIHRNDSTDRETLNIILNTNLGEKLKELYVEDFNAFYGHKKDWRYNRG